MNMLDTLTLWTLWVPTPYRWEERVGCYHKLWGYHAYSWQHFRPKPCCAYIPSQDGGTYYPHRVFLSSWPPLRRSDVWYWFSRKTAFWYHQWEHSIPTSHTKVVPPQTRFRWYTNFIARQCDLTDWQPLWKWIFHRPTRQPELCWRLGLLSKSQIWETVHCAEAPQKNDEWEGESGCSCASTWCGDRWFICKQEHTPFFCFTAAKDAAIIDTIHWQWLFVKYRLTMSLFPS